MCQIFVIPRGSVVPHDKMENSILNNPHGYGLVFRDRGKLEVVKKFDPKGNDPEEIMKLLENAKDVETFLHLRWATAGAKDEANCHPHGVYFSKGRQVEMMHNGTLVRFRDATSDKSDTANFGSEFVTPLLSNYRGEKGTGSIKDAFVNEIINEFVDGTNKVILISSDEGPTFYNQKAWNWEMKETKKVYDDKTKKMVAVKEVDWVSANTYSFRKGYREPVSRTTYYNSGNNSYPYHSRQSNAPWQGWGDKAQAGETAKSNKTKTAVLIAPPKKDTKVSKGVTPLAEVNKTKRPANVDRAVLKELGARTMTDLAYVTTAEWEAFVASADEYKMTDLFETLAFHAFRCAEASK